MIRARAPTFSVSVLWEHGHFFFSEVRLKTQPPTCFSSPHYSPRSTMAGPPLQQPHEEEADLSPRWCAEDCCKRRPFFGPPGGKPLYCAHHSRKSEGMVDVSSRRCEAVGCAKWPLYGNEVSWSQTWRTVWAACVWRMGELGYWLRWIYNNSETSASTYRQQWCRLGLASDQHTGRGDVGAVRSNLRLCQSWFFVMHLPRQLGQNTTDGSWTWQTSRRWIPGIARSWDCACAQSPHLLLSYKNFDWRAKL